MVGGVGDVGRRIRRFWFQAGLTQAPLLSAAFKNQSYYPYTLTAPQEEASAKRASGYPSQSNFIHTVKVLKYSSQGTISFDQQYIENNPIYGNLNLPILVQNNDECCYETMANHHERNIEENQQVNPEEQMCYADLDLNPKRPGKNRKKKAKPKSIRSFKEMDRANVDILSRSSIYLNSEQLTAECRAEEELIHDDPVRIYHLMKATNNGEESQSHWSN
ncbi:T-cell receptor-associated transmembrane adapter 1 isoform X1 [Ranitomeya variabilis]|uniref:T-cell receptor-associated transmembrane adapter 1 isoform X1 n=1 Tax=Ranitomeya variabilis TaxID=490064 RepID=UPI0040564A92